MKILKVVFYGIFLITLGCNQSSVETEKERAYDDEDLKNIFSMIGVNSFKFPFEVKHGEYISISYEIFEYGNMIDSVGVIENLMYENEILFNHHHSRHDTTYYSRLYFYEKEDSLKIHFHLHGVSCYRKVDISNTANNIYNQVYDVEKNLDYNERQVILYYISLYGDSDNYNKLEGWIRCKPQRDINEEIVYDFISGYDLVIIFYAERISAEKAMKLLGDDFYKDLSCPLPKD